MFFALKTSPKLKIDERQPQREKQTKISTFLKCLATPSAIVQPTATQPEPGSSGEDAISNSACKGSSTHWQAQKNNINICRLNLQ